MIDSVPSSEWDKAKQGEKRKSMLSFEWDETTGVEPMTKRKPFYAIINSLTSMSMWFLGG